MGVAHGPEVLHVGVVVMPRSVLATSVERPVVLGLAKPEPEQEQSERKRKPPGRLLCNSIAGWHNWTDNWTGADESHGQLSERMRFDCAEPNWNRPQALAR